MPEVGLRELKTRASEILRDVRERHARYVITYRGRPVGVLLPFREAEQGEPEEPDPWEELVRLGKEIEERWPSAKTSEEILSEMRR